VLCAVDAELVVEGVAPDLVHVVPVRHDAVLGRILQEQDTRLRTRLTAVRFGTALREIEWWSSPLRSDHHHIELCDFVAEGMLLTRRLFIVEP
jgi:hypothetical protein